MLRINLLSKGNETDENNAIRISLSRIIGDAIKEILFHDLIPECFIASAERTGAVIFKEELNFEKNSILREVATSEEIRIENIVDKIYNTSYALPVRRNIDFIRNLESISKEDGLLYREHPEVIDSFNSMVGGEYKISKEGIYYSPSKNVKLSIGESASSIRSLLDIYFYLRYVARKGHMLMIDEPEMNLHPSYQRIYARILAMLVNFGIKVFITTHSDYIVKEFNTLLMLNYKKEKESIKKLITAYNYSENQFLSASNVKMFISEINNVLLPGNKRKTKTLRKIHLIDIPDNAIIVKMDDVKFHKFLKPNKELGYNKHSDYMLIASNKIVFFELKSKSEVNESLNEECITKFSSDLCVTKYSDSIFDILLKEGTFFDGKDIHYVLLYQLPTATKRPTSFADLPPNSSPQNYRRISVANDSVLSYLRAI